MNLKANITSILFTLLLIVFLTIPRIILGQNKESIIDVHTDNKAYFRVQETDQLLSIRDSQIVILQTEFKVEQKFADSMAMEFNILKHDATLAIKNEKQSGRINKTLVTWLVPTLIIETITLYFLIR